VEQQWDSESLPNHPSPCSKEYDHGLQTCLDLESVSDDMMFNNIKQFDWEYSDGCQDTHYWPEDSPSPDNNAVVHSNQQMFGFISNAFAERLEEVLTSCQPYPGDGESIEQEHIPLFSHFCVILQKDDILTICDNIQGFNSYLQLSQVRLSFFSIGNGMRHNVQVSNWIHIHGKQPING
jgi:hypothetical protein